ncbi:hypothetical protein GCM10023169_09450 [Georgenia halophila]|uniref:ABC-2 transporter permease n=1 Tax=Georgenia halophila TaxID=620889 RepID=A0ABP8L026_9MICO
MTATFARFDLMVWFPRRQTLLTLAFIAVAGVLLPVPGLAIVAAALVASLQMSAPFLADEHGRMDTLYGVLPISRGAVVAGRALSLLAYYAAAAVLATAVTITMASVRGDQITVELVLIAHACAAGVVGIAMSLQLPILFRVGYSRGRLMVVYAPTIVMFGAAWLLQATGLHTPLLNALSDVPAALVIGAGLAVAVLGVLVAVGVSTRFYRTREL